MPPANAIEKCGVKRLHFVARRLRSGEGEFLRTKHFGVGVVPGVGLAEQYGEDSACLDSTPLSTSVFFPVRQVNELLGVTTATGRLDCLQAVRKEYPRLGRDAGDALYVLGDPDLAAPGTPIPGGMIRSTTAANKSLWAVDRNGLRSCAWS